MNVKPGDLILVDGTESTVETFWCQGNHKLFIMKDGKNILDLDKMIESGAASIIEKENEFLDMEEDLDSY